ncbi:phosphopantothenoylcysteine decarboxylase subunit VHS3-like [Citrus clementina]|uniref:Uncharacterized protein n=1 Tax=Citrus limon TaxID=2708 RepID=A0A1S8ACN9_CITLI|nr:phosphopantothenoylcysteine decarboxylase subunit VHS3-like [Citrus x clementina]
MLNMEIQSLCSSAVALGTALRSAIEAVVAETAIVAAKSISLSLLVIGTMPHGTDLLCKEPSAFGRFPFGELYAVKKPDPENKDGSDTEDDEEDDDDDAAEDPDDEEGEEEDGSGEEGKDNGDPEDEPEANGDGASGDDDDEEEDDDDDDGEEEDDDDDEEDEDEDEDEIPQPPTKKRK